MTFQVRSILLYNADGRVRRLDFRLGQLNIVTGASKTGKSSIIDIIDYCLGSTSFTVAAGVISDTVATYALVLEVVGGQQVLLARPKPPRRQATTSVMCLRVGDFSDAVPVAADLQPNTNVDSVRAYLSDLIGIEENRLEPATGNRLALTASLRHALFFVFQGQGEVANPDILFHSQAEEYVPQAIRDVLPYFLGAVDREQILKRQRMRTLNRELRLLRRDLDDEIVLVGTTSTAAALVREAISVGLIEDTPQPELHTDALLLLARAASASVEPAVDLPSEDSYLQLVDDRDGFRRRLGELQAELRLVKHIAAERSDFDAEASEQGARLASLELVPDRDSDATVCPLCTSHLDTPVLGVAELRDALAAMTAEIGAVRTGSPRVQELQGQLESQLADVRELVRRNSIAIRELDSSRVAIATFRDDAVRRAVVRGRVSLYLDTARRQMAQGAIADRVAELEREIAQLEEELDAARTAESLESALSRINREISRIAVDLDLEHAQSPIRLDIRRLTVVADTGAGPVPMSSMGSGENWLGYHVAALLSLHDWFVTENRPVPRFLVLDQPSQVYFPADVAADAAVPAADEDRLALARVMNALLGAVTRHGPNLQIIVTDHADLQEDWFQSAVVERWRDGAALIPRSWLE